MHGKESNAEVCNMYQGQTVIVFFGSVDSPILFATAYAQSTICSLICITVRASDISWKKKQNFAGFLGANSRKNRPISWDFRGKKVKICRKIGRFRGRKVNIRRKSGQFREILAEKSQISKDFQGQILRKIGRFHGKFRGETSPRNNQ